MIWIKLADKKPERDQVVLIKTADGAREARYVLEEIVGCCQNLDWYFRYHPRIDENERINADFISSWCPLPEEEVIPKNFITTTRYEDILFLLEGYESIAQSIMDTYGITTLAHLPDADYHKVCKKIEGLKRAHDAYDGK